MEGCRPKGSPRLKFMVGLQVCLLGKTKSEVVNSFCLFFFFFLTHWLGFFPPFSGVKLLFSPCRGSISGTVGSIQSGPLGGALTIEAC